MEFITMLVVAGVAILPMQSATAEMRRLYDGLCENMFGKQVMNVGSKLEGTPPTN